MRTALLTTVVVKGVAGTDAVADAADLTVDEAGRILAELAEAGLVRHRSGRMTGWSPTAEGRAELPRLIRAAGLRLPPEDVYQDFVAVNADFKRLCLDWQVTRPAVTAELTGRLADVHERVGRVVDGFAAAQTRFAAYGRRLDAARGRFLAGDPDALTGIRAESCHTMSYHTIWMELHADILATLGRARTEQDGS
jgi:hypothetical protein